MNLEIDGCNIEYRMSGDGSETVVILQGWGTQYGMYDLIAGCLQKKYRVVQFDFPGFGKSDEPEAAWNVDDYTRFFRAFMERLGIRRASLIGHSFGGRVIIKLAAGGGSGFIIDRIVLLDSAGVMPKRSFRQKAKVWKYKRMKRILNWRPVYVLFPEIIDDWNSRQGSADYQSATPLMRQVLVKTVNEDLTALLPEIKSETLLIWGDQDKVTPLSDAKLMEKLIPGSGLAVIPGAGHFSYLEKPDLFRSILSAYFQLG